MYFEDIEPGFEIKTEPQIVTRDMIEKFADLTGDHNPLHLDEYIAERGPFKGIVAHGRLTGDCAIGLLPYDLIEGVMLLDDSTGYVRPVRPDDHVHSIFRIKGKYTSNEKSLFDFAKLLLGEYCIKYVRSPALQKISLAVQALLDLSSTLNIPDKEDKRWGYLNCEMDIMNQDNKPVARMYFRMRANRRES